MEPIDLGSDGPDALRQVREQLEQVAEKLEQHDVSGARRDLDATLDDVGDAIAAYDGGERSIDSADSVVDYPGGEKSFG